MTVWPQIEPTNWKRWELQPGLKINCSPSFHVTLSFICENLGLFTCDKYCRELPGSESRPFLPNRRNPPGPPPPLSTSPTPTPENPTRMLTSTVMTTRPASTTRLTSPGRPSFRTRTPQLRTAPTPEFCMRTPEQRIRTPESLFGTPFRTMRTAPRACTSGR